ncbi:MAG: hypothetical protein MMC23_008117 [Stictis urceolatum]|nr:hypothetical protein [Stictis urceolata]
MSSTSTHPKHPSSQLPLTLPTPTRQLTYLSTGALAGLTTVPLRHILSLTSTSPKSLPLPPILTPTLRAATRFYTFDLVRTNLPPLPLPLSAAISGASSGISEVLLHSLVADRRLPAKAVLGSHAGKLFLGFGTFTGLALLTRKARGEEGKTEEGGQGQGNGNGKGKVMGMPPRPFWWCWCLGGLAGGVAVGGVGAMERVWRGRGREGVWRRSFWRGFGREVGVGAAVVGTAISVQVTLCREVLDWLGE